MDDEPSILAACRDIFSTKDNNQYKVVVACSGNQALDILEDERSDIALIDLKMPGLSGEDLIKIVKKKYPKISIIVMTGYATINTVVETMKLGIKDFIPKPFTTDELFNKVEDIVNILSTEDRE